MKKMMLAGMAALLAAASLAQPPKQDRLPKPPVAERWTHDSTKLQLYVVFSPTQTERLKTVFFSFYQSVDTLMQKVPPAPPAREPMEQIIRTRDEALQQIFTPDQRIRFQTFRKELMPPPAHMGGPPVPTNF